MFNNIIQDFYSELYTSTTMHDFEGCKGNADLLESCYDVLEALSDYVAQFCILDL